MHLGEIAALGAKLFPDVRNRVDPDNINATVSQVEEIIHHFIKYPGVLVIQIPLIRVKTGHNKMACIRKPGEIARRCRRKYLGHGLFIHGRDRIIIKEEIPAHVFPFSGPGPLRPLVVLRCMVHDKIHADVDAFFVAGFGQILQILHGAKLFLHLAEIRHRIAAV